MRKLAIVVILFAFTVVAWSATASAARYERQAGASLLRALQPTVLVKRKAKTNRFATRGKVKRQVQPKYSGAAGVGQATHHRARP